MQVKTESLVWHSPMLNDISSVRSWQKVCTLAGCSRARRHYALGGHEQREAFLGNGCAQGVYVACKVPACLYNMEPRCTCRCLRGS
jgi:hypothetical protein